MSVGSSVRRPAVCREAPRVSGDASGIEVMWLRWRSIVDQQSSVFAVLAIADQRHA